jgi:uridine phosphorylase
MKNELSETNLVLNPDGSVYHLHITANDIANTVILVGNPNRVERVSKHFDQVEKRISHREFVTHTGWFNKNRLTVIGCGIGTDNIDIVLNELYAATHFDPKSRLPTDKPRPLDIIRLGTSGAIQPDIEVGSFLASEYGLGVDGLLYYYDYAFGKEEQRLMDMMRQQINWKEGLAQPYFTTANIDLLERYAKNTTKGVTVAATGFYGPQGRFLKNENPTFNLYESLRKIDLNGKRVTNFDMETAALYGLGKYFGFRCLTLNVIIANRATSTFSKNPGAVVDELIAHFMEHL